MLRLVSLNFDDSTAEIRAYDNFECVSYKQSKFPRSHFIRGHITGWFSQLMGSIVEVEEQHCVAMGHPFCYFAVKPRKSADE
jgi:predicted hydrocarbon binding protein